MKIEVGAYEAKTKLPQLLCGIQAGNRYTLTLRGMAVADLVPAELALRTGLPLATLDTNLAKAAATAGVPIFGAH